jgi:hypothetical protein
MSHPVTLLADGDWFDEWLAGTPIESLIVSYADKRAGQRLESMADRFASWQRRYPPEERRTGARGGWSAQTVADVWNRAQVLETRVCELTGVAAADVRRLPWTGPAIRLVRES